MSGRKLKRACLWLVTAALLGAAAPVLAASSAPELWTIGSGNATVTCGVAVTAPGTPPSQLLCDALAVPAPRAPGLGDPGNVFLQAHGVPELARLSQDEFAGTKAVQLASGARWSAFGVSCRVSAARVRCVNESGHGFVIGDGGYAPVTVHAGQRVSASVPALFRRVDWKTLTVPAGLCGTTHAVALLAGSAVAASTRWPGTPRVELRLGGASYGDLDGAGEDGAAINLSCSNLGGMADGELADGWLVYLAHGGALRFVGELTTHGAPQARGLNPTTIASVAIEPGRLTARELFYKPSDPTCCPSGKATGSWRYRDGVLEFERVMLGG